MTPDAEVKGIRTIIESVDGRLFDKTIGCPKCSSGEKRKLGAMRT